MDPKCKLPVAFLLLLLEVENYCENQQLPATNGGKSQNVDIAIPGLRIVSIVPFWWLMLCCVAVLMHCLTELAPRLLHLHLQDQKQHEQTIEDHNLLCKDVHVAPPPVAGC